MKKYIIALTFVLILISAMDIQADASNNDPTGYPYKSSAKGLIDKWNFYTRYCTSYSAYRADMQTSNFHNTMTGPNGKTGRFGNANNWNDNAKNLGFTVSTNPIPGSIFVVEANQEGSGPVGHVGYVESVAGNNFKVSEYNWNRCDSNYSTRSIINSKPYSFIEFGKNASGCSPPSQKNWSISSACVITNNTSYNGNIIIERGGTLQLKNGASLNLNLNTYTISIKPGGKLTIAPDARIN